jgi:hypothetical protein
VAGGERAMRAGEESGRGERAMRAGEESDSMATRRMNEWTRDLARLSRSLARVSPLLAMPSSRRVSFAGFFQRLASFPLPPGVDEDTHRAHLRTSAGINHSGN